MFRKKLTLLQSQKSTRGEGADPPPHFQGFHDVVAFFWRVNANLFLSDVKEGESQWRRSFSSHLPIYRNRQTALQRAELLHFISLWCSILQASMVGSSTVHPNKLDFIAVSNNSICADIRRRHTLHSQFTLTSCWLQWLRHFRQRTLVDTSAIDGQTQKQNARLHMLATLVKKPLSLSCFALVGLCTFYPHSVSESSLVFFSKNKKITRILFYFFLIIKNKFGKGITKSIELISIWITKTYI